MTDPADTGLDADLGWTLGVLFRAYARAAERVLADLPAGPRGHQVLTAAVGDPPRNQGAIAEEIGVDRTVMTYLVDDLERAGLVARHPDPADRRSRLVIATDLGRRTWREHRDALRRAEAHVLAPLSRSDAATLRALLREVACAAQRRDPLTDLCDVVAEAEGR